AAMSSGLQAGFDEKPEGPGAMRQGRRIAGFPAVLFLRAHFPEGRFVTVRLEDWIVTEAPGAARRPDDLSLHLAAEHLGMSVRPGKAEHRDEAGGAVLRRDGSLFGQRLFHLLHRHGEITCAIRLLRPVRRIDAGGAVEGVDDDAGIVRSEEHTSE